ncbi:MAG: sulfate adenylyltransferase [Bacillota bacterium]|nr:sulfate adenylyltransferase [Bacillota bacterium]
MLEPYGGALLERWVQGEEARELSEKAKELPYLPLTPRMVSDLILLSQGAYSPLPGFMDRKTYQSVLEHMSLAQGLPWTLPVTLSARTGETLPPGDLLALGGPDGVPRALLQVEDIFWRDRAFEAKAVFGTDDPRHPGVRLLLDEGDLCVGGTVTLFRPFPDPFQPYALTPKEARAAFSQRGWQTIVAFQTRNPIHRAHEYLQKCALEIFDGLFLHPLVGVTKEDDVPAAVRWEAYETLLRHYYPSHKVILSPFPGAMRYAGPREAIHHAIVRRNYGCTHIIIGRDHAGVGQYYAPTASQEIFHLFPKEVLGIQPLFFAHAFYCRRCQAMATENTCPHGPEDHVHLSGTAVREALRKEEDLPLEFSRPEVASLLREAYRERRPEPLRNRPASF